MGLFFFDFKRLMQLLFRQGGHTQQNLPEPIGLNGLIGRNGPETLKKFFDLVP